jgi:hypothetical protein
VQLKCIDLILLLGRHSMPVRDLHRFIQLFYHHPFSQRSFLALVNCFKEIATKRVGPCAYFSFNGTEDSSINLSQPGSVWPGTKGFSFSTWLCIQSLHIPTTPELAQYVDVGPRILSCFSDNGAYGFEIFFNPISGSLHMTSHIQHRMQLIDMTFKFKPERWYHVCIMHRANGDNVRLFVNGEVRFNGSLRYPHVDTPLNQCLIGSNYTCPAPAVESLFADGRAFGATPRHGWRKTFQNAEVQASSCRVNLRQNFTGQLGTICLFDDILSREQIDALYNLGCDQLCTFSPSERQGFSQMHDAAVSAAFDGGLHGHLAIMYSARATHRQSCLDISPPRSVGPINAIAGRGVHACMTYNLRDVLYCVGGMRVLLPLLSSASSFPSDSPVSVERAVVKVLDVIGEMLRDSQVNQNFMQRCDGFGLCEFLLHQLPAEALGSDVLQSVPELMSCVSNISELQQDCFRSLMNPKLWVHAPYELHVKYVSILTEKSSKVDFTPVEICDLLRDLYWIHVPSSLQYGVDRDRLATQHKNLIDVSAFDRRRLTAEQLKILRAQIFELLHARFDANLVGTVGAVVQFLSDCDDVTQLKDMSDFVRELAVRSPEKLFDGLEQLPPTEEATTDARCMLVLLSPLVITKQAMDVMAAAPPSPRHSSDNTTEPLSELALFQIFSNIRYNILLIFVHLTSRCPRSSNFLNTPEFCNSLRVMLCVDVDAVQMKIREWIALTAICTSQPVDEIDRLITAAHRSWRAQTRIAFTSPSILRLLLTIARPSTCHHSDLLDVLKAVHAIAASSEANSLTLDLREWRGLLVEQLLSCAAAFHENAATGHIGWCVETILSNLAVAHINRLVLKNEGEEVLKTVLVLYEQQHALHGFLWEQLVRSFLFVLLDLVAHMRIPSSSEFNANIGFVLTICCEFMLDGIFSDARSIRLDESGMWKDWELLQSVINVSLKLLVFPAFMVPTPNGDCDGLWALAYLVIQGLNTSMFKETLEFLDKVTRVTLPPNRSRGSMDTLAKAAWWWIMNTMRFHSADTQPIRWNLIASFAIKLLRSSNTISDALSPSTLTSSASNSPQDIIPGHLLQGLKTRQQQDLLDFLKEIHTTDAWDSAMKTFFRPSADLIVQTDAASNHEFRTLVTNLLDGNLSSASPLATTLFVNLSQAGLYAKVLEWQPSERIRKEEKNWTKREREANVAKLWRHIVETYMVRQQRPEHMYWKLDKFEDSFQMRRRFRRNRHPVQHPSLHKWLAGKGGEGSQEGGSEEAADAARAVRRPGVVVSSDKSVFNIKIPPTRMKLQEVSCSFS